MVGWRGVVGVMLECQLELHEHPANTHGSYRTNNNQNNHDENSDNGSGINIKKKKQKHEKY